MDALNPSWRKKHRILLGSSPYRMYLWGPFHHFYLDTILVNEPLESISRDLGFRGNILAEGLVASMCLGGALIGSLFSGWIADAVGCRWLFVGTGLGLGPPAVAGVFRGIYYSCWHTCSGNGLLCRESTLVIQGFSFGI
ncbi:hypothetical protein Ahy_B07g088705 [Arachis hypogaea]|uniref:Uncharacterized protein n=1 Tax=Arachis hypogaea TaxID=3818 RepID=A0A444YF62_ARAHY|nr:hypothetical protein Ahy_B07g088705 [Arachis hypogaea]